MTSYLVRVVCWTGIAWLLALTAIGARGRSAFSQVQATPNCAKTESPGACGRNGSVGPPLNCGQNCYQFVYSSGNITNCASSSAGLKTCTACGNCEEKLYEYECAVQDGNVYCKLKRSSITATVPKSCASGDACGPLIEPEP
jgi:hypothetical protein